MGHHDGLSTREVTEFIIVATLLGASYMFMRVAVPEFGPVPLICIRAWIAAASLSGVLWVMKPSIGLVLVVAARPVLVVSVFNITIPLCLLAYASLHLSAGFTALVVASTPCVGAVAGRVWFSSRLSRRAIIGLVVSAVGMVVLTWGKVGFRHEPTSLAVLAGFGASASFGFATHYAKRHLQHAGALFTAFGTQLAAGVLLLPLGVWAWPSSTPGAGAWMSALLLGVASTALAHTLYFRLIASAGAQRASAVALLTPVFASLWGFWFLGEALTPLMVFGGSVVLCGTGLCVLKAGNSAR